MGFSPRHGLKIVRAMAFTFPLLMIGVAVPAEAGSDTPAPACAAANARSVTHAEAALNKGQLNNASTIKQTGLNLKVPEPGEVIAIATALQESSLRDLDHGDRDSLGLFQQRPSQGWGTRSQILDPIHASSTFYRHLLTIPGWRTISVAQAAQAVQRSAYPTAYAKWEPLARDLVTLLPEGGACLPH